MKAFVGKMTRFLAAEDGPTAVEYAVMISLIIVVCLSAISSVGANASKVFNVISSSINR
jgi:pilus assembly protein Flp/PilA